MWYYTYIYIVLHLSPIWWIFVVMLSSRRCNFIATVSHVRKTAGKTLNASKRDSENRGGILLRIWVCCGAEGLLLLQLIWEITMAFPEPIDCFRFLQHTSTCFKLRLSLELKMAMRFLNKAKNEILWHNWHFHSKFFQSILSKLECYKHESINYINTSYMAYIWSIDKLSPWNIGPN